MNDIFCIGKTSDSQNFNLHNHTTFSDGVYTVKELCQQASVNTITNFSITDHDTIDAYTK
jgi:predicted metal-dependent phosphoesterase TrpH